MTSVKLRKSTRALNHFLLLYASQGGQSKAIAEEIADTAPSYGLHADIFCTSLTGIKFNLENEKCAVFVVSTTGDGEPPDTAMLFFLRLLDRGLRSNSLENLNYAMLALGDSNFDKFCNFGCLLEKRLKQLSAKSFYPTCHGDDAYGIETAVDPWIQNLWVALRKQLSLEPLPQLIQLPIASKNMEGADILSICDIGDLLKKFNLSMLRTPRVPNPIISLSFKESCINKGKSGSPENFFVMKSSMLVKALLVSAKRMTFDEDVKKTLELTFKFSDEKLHFKPGDAFGFICVNSENYVNALLQRLNIIHSADKTVELFLNATSKGKTIPKHLEGCLTLRELLLHRVEICAVPSKVLLKVFCEYATDDNDKNCLYLLSSYEGSKIFTNCIRKSYLTVLDILMHFKSCNPPIEKILEFLPPLKPRFYSLIGSPLVDDESFSILFNVVEIKKGGGRFSDREGVCTGYLNQLTTYLYPEYDKQSTVQDMAIGISSLSFGYKEERELYVYRKPNYWFYVPDDLTISLIMVGPGTGVSPFIGFLRHREQQILASMPDTLVGETWLFYGCRYKQKDFLYKEELQRLQSCKVLTHLIVSFSREPSSEKTICRYVHDNIRVHSKEVAATVKSGAMIYFCGDIQHMARDVKQAFLDVFQSSMDLNYHEAKRYMEGLENERKYVTDIWPSATF